MLSTTTIKNMRSTIALLMSLHFSMSVASDNHAQTSLVPSSELLQLVGISDYQVSNEIIIRSGETRGTPDKIGQCENPVIVPLKALAMIKNISKVIAAIETASHGKQKRLFTLHNDGGLTRSHTFLSVRLDIREYNPGMSNIWIFFLSEDQTYANAVQIRCQVAR